MGDIESDRVLHKPSRGRSQPPVQEQERQAWHDRHQKPIGNINTFDLAPGKLQTKWLGPYRTHNGAVQLEVGHFLYLDRGSSKWCVTLD